MTSAGNHTTDIFVQSIVALQG